MPIYIWSETFNSRRVSASSRHRWDSSFRTDLNDSIVRSICWRRCKSSFKLFIVLERSSAPASLCRPGWVAGLYINRALTISRACSNPATNSSPISNGLLNLPPSAIFHHSVRLNFGSADVSDLVGDSRVSSGAEYVSGFLMSEKLRNATVTGSGTEGELPHDSRRPIIHAAESYSNPLSAVSNNHFRAKKSLPLHCAGSRYNCYPFQQIG